MKVLIKKWYKQKKKWRCQTVLSLSPRWYVVSPPRSATLLIIKPQPTDLDNTHIYLFPSLSLKMEDMPMPMTPPGAPMSNVTMKGMAMHTSFFWGSNVTILFQGWPDNNLGMYILSLAFVFLLSVAVEVLSVPPAVKPGTSPAVGGLTQSTVYALRMALAYMVMLSVMSFNLGVFIVAIAGHTLGFFVVKFRALSLASSQAAAATENNIPKVWFHTPL